MRVRDEEIGRRDEYNRRQMELLQSLVQGVQMQGENASRRATEVDKDVKMPKLTAEDDIVAYLTTFERLMRAYEVKRERWVFKLATNLIGKAQQAYAGLSTEDANNYDKVKEAILQRYDITEESYRQRFRVAKRKLGESNKEIVARLNDLASKWLKSCKSPEEVRDKIVLEQFLNMQSEELKVFIRERKPSSSEEAGRLADDYFRARKESVSERDRRSQESRRQEKPGRHCLKCGNSGHHARDCRTKMEKANDWREKPKPKWDPKDIECHNCHKKGHYSFNCPHRAMFCTERKMEVSGQISVVKRPVQSKPGVVKSGKVKGEAVDDILLDTGCSRTLVHRKLVPKEKAQDGEAVPMKNIDAGSVADELIKIFSRVGVPQEILTDQGTNFTSQLLIELYKMLHIQPIRTTPYHPQTDGLVERFNQTLKSMLRKTAVKEGLDWDKMLPYVLFAYREVPQTSTGFSPFELLYGYQVRGPLDVLKESWQSSEKTEESVISHILTVRDNLGRGPTISMAIRWKGCDIIGRGIMGARTPFLPDVF